MIYTGIGSRSTPRSILDLMTEVGIYFGKHGITLRSGGASGADTAFEQGCDSVGGPKQIFFPSQNFNGKLASNRPGTYWMGGPFVDTQMALAEAEIIWNIRNNMPCIWKHLKCFTQLLMGRNTLQILGPTLQTPTKIVICWTKDGEAIGGTGQALSMAQSINENIKLSYVIPILNLQKESHREAIVNVLKGANPIKLIDYAQEMTRLQYNKEIKE